VPELFREFSPARELVACVLQVGDVNRLLVANRTPHDCRAIQRNHFTIGQPLRVTVSGIDTHRVIFG
jgi:hypothetical protein